MKILQIIQKPQNRGAEIFACQLANHLQEFGNEVKVVSVFDGIGKLPWNEEIESLKASKRVRFLDFEAWKKLNVIINDFNPDIVQANSGDTLKYAVFSKKIFGWKAPIIFRNASEVGQYLKSYLKKKINSYLYRSVTEVVSVSETSRKDFIEQFPFLKERVTFIPIGIEECEIGDIHLHSNSKHNLIHVGGFTYEKNHIGLISIINKLKIKMDDFHLHLLGDGPLRSSVEKLVKEQDLGEKVTFYGFVDEPLPYIKSANVLLLPSIIEGLPGVILEAMYCKTPVIAYDVGGIKEVLNTGTGYLIPKHNEDLFVQFIIEVLKLENYDKTNKAFQMVRHSYTNLKVAKKFKNLYRSVQ